MSQRQVLRVTLTLVRAGKQHRPVGRRVAGLLIDELSIDAPMFVIDALGRHIRTSPIKRILGSLDQGTVYVETANSVYSLEPWDPTAAMPLPRAVG